MSSIVDGSSTSDAWQRHENGLAVWSVGAFEQHGHHLPLETDNIQAEYFARFLAGELGAALLPNLPFGTSLEHAGFRGSISLTPELLMGMLEQIVTELESQNFRVLILVNGHGGNFALAPKVRQINRQDRNIKILLVNHWMHYPPITATAAMEVHSGESETSVMLALRPACVGKDRRDGSPSVGNDPFTQPDLNTFGVGRMNVNGVWGYPSKGSAAQGRKLIAGARTNLLAWVRARLEKLGRDPRYGGAGPVALREFTPADIPFGMRLKTATGWNQTPADWAMLLAAGQGGHYIALHQGRPAGTVTTVSYDKRFSWIGMLLVDAAMRRRGVGTRLLTAAIEHARARGPVRLDATPEGRELYLTMGFKDEYRLTRHRRPAAPCTAQRLDGVRITPLRASDVGGIVRYDAPVFGARRDVILKHIFAQGRALAFVAREGRRIVGYCGGRHGSAAEQLGPIIAGRADVAEALLRRALAASGDRPAIVDTPDAQTDFVAALARLGFVAERPLIRMCHGELRHPGLVARQYSIAGPEIG